MKTLSEWIGLFDSDLNVLNKPSDTFLLSRALAAAFYSLDLKMDYTLKQLFPHLASAENLLVHCNVHGIHKRLASSASGKIKLLSNRSVTIEKGTRFTYQKNTYECMFSIATDDAHTATIPIESIQTGSSQNIPIGNIVKLETPIIGVNSECLVVEAIEGAYDDETNPSLLARLLKKLQYPPQGGSAMDYVHWALEVDGVANAFVYPLISGAGSVGLSIYELENNIPIPPSERLVQKVKNHIENNMPCTVSQLLIQPPKFKKYWVVISESIDAIDQDQIDQKMKAYTLLSSATGGHYFSSQQDGRVDSMEVMKIIHDVHPKIKLKYLLDDQHRPYVNEDMTVGFNELAVYQGLKVERGNK